MSVSQVGKGCLDPLLFLSQLAGVNHPSGLRVALLSETAVDLAESGQHSKNKTSGQGFSPPLAAAPTDPSFRDV